MRYIRVYEESITGTERKCYVPLLNVLVCNILSEHHLLLRRVKEFPVSRVYVSKKSLKHSYDRRPKYMDDNIEFIFRTIKDPDYICKNIGDKNGKKISKRGDFIFFKQRYDDKYYGIPMEVTKNKVDNKFLEIVSFFPTDSKYVKKFPTLWERDNPNGFPTLWDREDGGIPPS